MSTRTRPVLSGGSGIVDGPLDAVLSQLQRLKHLAGAVGAITGSSSVATSTLSDGVSNTLRLDARLPGAHGATIKWRTERRTVNGESLFDVEAFFPDANATGATFTADNTTETFTAAAHGFKTGDGPFYVSNSGGGLPSGLSATTPYWVITTGVNTFKLATTKANAVAGTNLLIASDGTGTQTIKKLIAELFSNCSMKVNHRRYVVNMINLGREGNPASDLIVATDLASANAENRPADAGPTALSGGGAGEVAVVGVQRGDHIASVINVTAGTVIAAASVEAVDKDKCVIKTGSSLGGSDVNVWVVLPK